MVKTCYKAIERAEEYINSEHFGDLSPAQVIAGL
jgi:hypothetical protein